MQRTEEEIIERALARGVLSADDIADCTRTVESLESLGVEKSIFDALKEHRLLTAEHIAELDRADDIAGGGSDQRSSAVANPEIENTAERMLKKCLFKSVGLPVDPTLTVMPAPEPHTVAEPAVEQSGGSPPVDMTIDFAQEELAAALEGSDGAYQDTTRRSSGMTALDIDLLMQDLDEQDTCPTASATPRSALVEDPGAELIGQIIGGCLIRSKLGQGAMGTVYKATHQALQKTVAVKVLNSINFCEKKQIEQFFSEARSAAAIDHHNIVTVHDVGNAGNHYYLVMQYIEGQSVEERMISGEPLKSREALRIVLEAAKGLDVAHKKGIVHRDIKPANLMLTKSGQVKIADFGLAYRGDADPDVTGGVEVMGTPSYMSPEQIDGRNVDHRSDLYSLGVTLYYLTTGKKPFEGATPMEVILKHVSEKPIPVCQLNPDMPQAVGQIVQRLMAKQPENRYASAEALVADLEDVLQGGKPTVVVAMEDVIQRMEELARTEAAPIRDRRPVIAAAFSGIAAAICVILFTFALPEIQGMERAGASLAEDPGQREARVALAGAEKFAGEHPEAIREITEQLEQIGQSGRTPYAGQATALLQNCKRKYDELSRQKADEWLSRASRQQADGHAEQALLTLSDIPEVWMLGAAGSEARKRQERLAQDLIDQTGMALVPGGTFLSGAEKTEEHLAPFLIDTTEVSNGQYERFIRESGHAAPPHWPDGKCPSELAEHPVCGVTYADARAFAAHVGKRLPTALEWEKAARGTDGRVYPWGDEFDQKRANCQGLQAGTTPVRDFFGGRSPYNCLNMAGNVHEWTDTVDSVTGEQIVMGGACRSYVTNVRTWVRLAVDPEHDDARLPVGFRCAKDVE